MSYVILDLEWNTAYSKTAHRFVNEIIEFGAVKTDDDFNEIASFERLITPTVGRKKLTGRVKELTRLTNEQLAEGGEDFSTVAKDFTEFLGDSVMMSWGTSDLHALIDNYLYYDNSRTIPFLTRYCDLQEYCERAIGEFDEGNQIGLGKFAEKIGISFSEEEQHRAAADAFLSLKCLRAVSDKLPIDDYVLQADCEEFYDRLLFKNYYITDITAPEVDREQMKFSCDRCGAQTKRLKKWKLRGKSFAADFTCKSCGRTFSGRVSFKQRYEGIKVTKRIVEKAEKTEKQTDK